MSFNNVDFDLSTSIHTHENMLARSLKEKLKKEMAKNRSVESPHLLHTATYFFFCQLENIFAKLKQFYLLLLLEI